MTATYVGAGTAATANYAGVTPGTPAGVAVGDLVVIHAGVRATAGTVNVPTGWVALTEQGPQRLLGRFRQSGDTTLPQVTFGGGAAGEDTMAQAFALRGMAPGVLDSGPDAFASISNASAQNITYPALDLDALADGRVLIMGAWKQDDASAVSTPASWAAILTTSTTTGNDAMLSTKYQIQATSTDIVSAALTVTGGAAAVSRAFIAALRPAAAFTVDPQDVWPPRNLLTLSGLTIGDAVELYRVAADGTRTLVRAGDVTVESTALLRVDAELPFGVPVSYLAIVNGVDQYTVAAATYDLPGGKVAITDAVTGLSAEVVILAWPSKRRTRTAERFAVGGRTVVVSGDLGMFTGQLELFTETTAGSQALENTLSGATEAVVQIRQPGGYDGVDSYVAVLDADQQRWSQDGSDDRRRWVLDVAEVEGWAPALEASGYTLQNVADVYTGQNLDDLSDDYATLLALAQGEFGS